MTPYEQDLVAGPYLPPRVKVGQLFMGHVLDQKRFGIIAGPHIVAGFWGGPVRWPYTVIAANHNPQLIVGGDLELAIRVESCLAVRYYFGVSRTWVERGRRILGVERMNPGTSSLWRTLLPSRMPVRGAPRRSGPWRVLTPAQAQELRARVAAGETRTALAEELGITRHHAGRIVSGRSRRM